MLKPKGNSKNLGIIKLRFGFKKLLKVDFSHYYVFYRKNIKQAATLFVFSSYFRTEVLRNRLGEAYVSEDPYVSVKVYYSITKM